MIWKLAEATNKKKQIVIYRYTSIRLFLHCLTICHYVEQQLVILETTWWVKDCVMIILPCIVMSNFWRIATNSRTIIWILSVSNRIGLLLFQRAMKGKEVVISFIIQVDSKIFLTVVRDIPDVKRGHVLDTTRSVVEHVAKIQISSHAN